MNIEELAPALANGIKRMGLEIEADKQELLLKYLALLVKWNKAYNLTAVRDPRAMLDRHLLDSLSVQKHVCGQRLIDVGTGPGLPGIPLAILNPHCEFTLLDSNGKKTRFLQQAKTELGLKNIDIQNCRVESFQPEQRFDVVLSRAFSTILDMVEGCYHLCKEDGVYLAMKGLYPQQELDDLQKSYPQVTLEKVHELQVPDCDAQRHLVELRQPQKI